MLDGAELLVGPLGGAAPLIEDDDAVRALECRDAVRDGDERQVSAKSDPATDTFSFHTPRHLSA